MLVDVDFSADFKYRVNFVWKATFDSQSFHILVEVSHQYKGISKQPFV